MQARRWIAIQAVGIVNATSRLIGRGSGTVVGGRAGLAIDPALLAELTSAKRVLLVSGTNGKTTTTALLAAALGELDPGLATNSTGSNMPPGHVASLVAARGASIAVLEVDEAYVEELTHATQPTALVLLNLSRDQLDRMNEVRMIAERWRRTLRSAPETMVIANADDPLVVYAAREAAVVVWVAGGLVWRNDATGCPACGSRIHFEGGGWACERCELSRPALGWWLDGQEAIGPPGSVLLSLALPGRFNEHNALMALAAAVSTGAVMERAVNSMATVHDVAGRFISRPIGGCQARLMLAKNPAGWSALVDLVADEGCPVVVSINARTADGADPSWLFDVDFTHLRGRPVVATGDRWRDLSVRLRYAEVEHVTQADPLSAVQLAASQGAGPVQVIGNYTAFRELLSSR